jgi:predicted amidohydrolase YtcJ
MHRIAMILAVAAPLVACGSNSPEVQPADLVLRGGRVVTVDEELPEGTAIAVRGGFVDRVGSDEEIAFHIGPDTRVVELKGRLAIPGLIEGHGHFLSLGDSKMILDLSSARSWDEIVSRVATAAEEAEPGAWIRGRGWHQEKWDEEATPSVEGAPVHESLSAVSPENPVVLGHASGHAAFANAKAMELAGLTRETENPPGGELVRSGDGELTGLLRETAQRAVSEALSNAMSERLPEEVDATRRRMVELAGKEALSKGITSFHDAGVSFETIEFYKQLEDEGALPVRLYAMVRYQSNEEMEARLPEYYMELEGNDFLTVRSIKRQIDGALGSHGAWLLEPYEDLPGSVGLVLEPEEEIQETARIAIQHGYQVNTHAIGDRANRRVLDIYEEIFEANGRPKDLRWRVEHAQHLHPDDIGRFAQLGVIAAIQGVHCTSDGPWVLKRLGEKRAEEGAYVWRKLIESGAILGNGTDVPVEPIDPIASYYSSVSRVMKDGGVFYPDQRMTREEALRSYTVNNAYAAFEEDLKGSLGVGKLADITVLSEDILTVPEERIPDIRVDMTIVGGEVRFERLP